jgi:hypothetical protein
MLVIYAFQYFIGYSFSENKRTFFRTGIAKAATGLAGKRNQILTFTIPTAYPRKTIFIDAAFQIPVHGVFHHRPEKPKNPLVLFRVNSFQVLGMVFHQPVKILGGWISRTVKSFYCFRHLFFSKEDKKQQSR